MDNSRMTSIDHVDLNLLRVFDAIVEARSLTLAGRRLSLSQPAVSYALGRLRVLFDDPLFIRTRDGMQPTPIALELARMVRQALDTVRDALRYAERFEAARSTRTFRLSLSDAGELAYLPPICEALHRVAPGVCVKVEPHPVEAIEEALRASRLDFAIGNLPELAARTRHHLLFDEDYVCMTRKRPGLPRTRQIDRDTFVGASHIQVTSVEHSHHALADAFRARGLMQQVALELPHFVALPDILRVTNHFTTLPRRLANIFNSDRQFRLFELPVDLPRASVTLHWHEAFDADQGNIWLRGVLIEMVGRLRSH
jgi:DNA-binding transcriptional LysR family regulator